MKTIEALFDKAKQASKNKDFLQSIELYKQIIDLDHKNLQAFHNLGALYTKLGDYTQALHAYKNVLDIAPDFTLTHFNLGVLFIHMQKLKEAKIQFNNVLSLDPSHEQALFYTGVLCLEEQELDNAEHSFRKVLQINSEHVETLCNLGVIALKRDQGQLAVDYFTQALALDNQHSDSRNNLAATFMHYDRYENALVHYEILLKENPNSIEYLYNSGVAEMALGHLKIAIDHFEKILTQDKKHNAALNNLASIYIKLDDKQKAKIYLENALKSNPLDKSSQHMLHALKGEELQTETSPEYAKNLFDNYALYYDNHMQNVLHYTLPDYMQKILENLDLSTQQISLDLGCGTGLLGVVLKTWSHTLTGVDISAKMLIQARLKNCYDRLIESDLNTFFTDDIQKFTLITAGDVLPYIGALDELFYNIALHLDPGGYFICSIELTQRSDWELQSTARFAHHPDYIKKLIEKFGLELISAEKVGLRTQNDVNMPIMVFIIRAVNARA